MGCLETNLEAVMSKWNHIIFEEDNNKPSECFDKGVFRDANGKNWNLYSQAGMTIPVKMWCDQFEKVSFRSVIFVFGIGCWDYVRGLMKKYTENRIVIYEPSEIIFKALLAEEDISDIVNCKNVIVITGKERINDLACVCNLWINYMNRKDIRFGRIPNYAKMFPQDNDIFTKFIVDEITMEEISRNTQIVKEERKNRCILYNLHDMIKQSEVSLLKKTFDSIDLKGLPAVIISAGPSLDKNIKILKKYEDRVFTICTDSALRTAKKYGILPDMIVTVDSHKDPTLFQDDQIRKIPVVVQPSTNYEITAIHQGKRFYSFGGEQCIKDLYQRFGKELTPLITGGSVANTAFSLLVLLGFQTIIFVGQDLAYPNNQEHAVDAYRGDKIDINDKSRFFYVESIDGSMIATEKNMDMYRMWFENQIAIHKEIKCIDATEGGALIHGAEIDTLENTIKGYCTCPKPDFKRIIQNVPNTFDKDEQKEVEGYIEYLEKSIPERIVELKKEAQIFDELDELNRGQKYHTKAFKKCMNDVLELFERMENDIQISFVDMFEQCDSFRIQDKLQSEEGDTYSEVKLIVETGRDAFDTYISGAKKLKELWTEIQELDK